MRLDLLGSRDFPVTVGRWTLTGLLGEGGMARVFRGELAGELGFRKPAAVKVLLPTTGKNLVEQKRQLVQEAQVGALLNHPNVVQTFDCGELEGFPFIAQELVVGAGAQELVGMFGALPPAAAVEITRQVALGLFHAHTAEHEGRPLRVIHRDIKPSNILIRTDGVVKVVDFGIAKAEVGDALTTATGMTKGTPSYMSPEQLAAESLDERSDLFALGAVLYFLLTGRTLFMGASITEVMLRIIQVDETMEARGVFSEVERLAPGVGTVLAQLLVKDRERRYDDAAQLAQDLGALGRGLPPGRPLKDLVREFRREQAGALPQPQERLEGESDPAVAWVPSLGKAALDGPGPTRLVESQGEQSGAALGPKVSGSSVQPVEATARWKDGEADPGVGETRTMQARSASNARLGGLRPSSVDAAPAVDRSAARVGAPIHTWDDEIDRFQAAAASRRQRRSIAVLLPLAVAAALWWFLRAPESVDPVDAAGGLAVQVAEEPEVPDAEPVSRAGVPAAEPEIRSASTPAPTPPSPTPAELRETATPAAAPAETPRPEATPWSRVSAVQEETGPTPPPSAPRTKLRMTHRPFGRATVGTSKTVTVYAVGPDDLRVVIHYRPVGSSEVSRRRLQQTGDGVWTTLLPIEEAFRATGFEYWIELAHPDTDPTELWSGSPQRPHAVRVY